jgi:hypothetical protein
LLTLSFDKTKSFELKANPYYITRPKPTTVKAPGKKRVRKIEGETVTGRKMVPVPAGDVCSAILQIPDLCVAYEHVLPLLQVHYVYHLSHFSSNFTFSYVRSILS